MLGKVWQNGTRVATELFAMYLEFATWPRIGKFDPRNLLLLVRTIRGLQAAIGFNPTISLGRPH